MSAPPLSIAPRRRPTAATLAWLLWLLIPALPASAWAQVPEQADQPAATPREAPNSPPPAAAESATAAEPDEQEPAEELDPLDTEAQTRELMALQEQVKQFTEAAEDFRREVQYLIEKKYNDRREGVTTAYDRVISDLEVSERVRRADAIALFKRFIEKYPDEPTYTPDAMYRLAELYFEQAGDNYFQAMRRYDEQIRAFDRGEVRVEPEMPTYRFEKTIALFQRLIAKFPDYRYIDGAYYLLGYCLNEQGEPEEATRIFEELVKRYPDSEFGPEVWTRIGEYYFDEPDLPKAARAYSQVLKEPDSPYYDKALYKLAWTSYRLDEFEEAVTFFARLIEFYDKERPELSKGGATLRQEAIQYIAISFADGTWPGAGVDNLLAFLQGRDSESYDRDVLAALAEVRFIGTNYAAAARVYKLTINRYPLHPDNPKLQRQVLLSFQRMRDFDQANAERVVLVQTYSEGSEWYEANRNNFDALQVADELTQQSLYAAALFQHQQAQAYKEKGEAENALIYYREAADAYGEYLGRFPHSKDAYELRYRYADTLYFAADFEKAAPAFEQVRDSQHGDAHRAEAALSAVLAYQRHIDQLEKTGALEPVKPWKAAERPEVDPEKIEPKEFPQVRKSYVDAIDRFRELAPLHERVDEVTYQAAELYYIYDHLEVARERLGWLVDNFGSSDVGRFSANLILETYILTKDWVQVEVWAEKVGRMQEVVEDRTKRQEAQTQYFALRSGAIFFQANELFEKMKYLEAAEQYLRMVALDPKNDNADRALNNAAYCYEQAASFASAMRIYERLFRDYPNSELADQALFRVAYNAEQAYNFDKAIAEYRKLVRNYPDSTNHYDAMFNLALLLENTQAYEQAAQQYQTVATRYPEKEDAPKLFFRSALVYKRMGDLRRMISTLDQFIRRYGSRPDQTNAVMEAYMRIAEAHQELGDERREYDMYQTLVDEYRRREISPDDPGSYYAAKAKFLLIEQEYQEYLAIKITGNMKQQEKLIQQKAEKLTEMQEKYREVFEFKRIEWTLAALYRIGHGFDDFADTLYKAPVPPIPRELRGLVDRFEWEDTYRIQLEDQAIVIEDKAAAAYERTLLTSRERAIVNEWSERALLGLNKFRPSEYPVLKEPEPMMSTEIGSEGNFLDTADLTMPLPMPEVEVATMAVEDEQDEGLGGRLDDGEGEGEGDGDGRTPPAGDSTDAAPPPPDSRGAAATPPGEGDGFDGRLGG